LGIGARGFDDAFGGCWTWFGGLGKNIASQKIWENRKFSRMLSFYQTHQTMSNNHQTHHKSI
jgi:hypothetical protein